MLVAAALALFSGGDDRSYARTRLLWPAQQAAAPAWTRPCWPTARWTDKRLCVHVSGRVVWIQRHDPDGDGDRHLLIVGRMRPQIVKLVKSMPVTRLPAIGTRIDAVGWLMKGASGHDEVNAQRVSWAGVAKMTQSGAAFSLRRRTVVG